MKNSTSYILMCLIFCFIGNSSTIFSQTDETGLDLLEEDAFFFSGASNTLLAKNRTEVNAYLSLNAFTLGFQESFSPSPIVNQAKISTFTTNLEVYHGFSYTQRWNLGLRLRYAHRRLDNQVEASALKVLQFSEEEQNNGLVNRTFNGLTGVGLRLRFTPIKSVPQLVFNGGYTFSSVRSEEFQQGLNSDRNQIDLLATYYIKLNTNSYYYFIANALALHPSQNISTLNSDRWSYNAGSSFFLVHLFANQKFTFYPGLIYNLNFKSAEVLNQGLIKQSEQLLGSVGLQFQVPKDGFSMNVSFAYPLILNTEQLGIQQLKNDFLNVNIGIRKEI